MSRAFSGTSGQWNSESVSASRGRQPYVYTGNRWVKASSQNLSTIVAKEIAGKLTGNLSSVSTNLLPAWYRAGSSWFLARAALGEAGVISYDDERWSVCVPNSRRADRPLKDLESWQGFSDALSEGSGSPYQCSMLAIELLVSLRGQSALVDFFSSTHQSKSWRVTFNETFGITFDAHRATGLPKPWQVLVISNRLSCDAVRALRGGARVRAFRTYLQQRGPTFASSTSADYQAVFRKQDRHVTRLPPRTPRS